MSATTPFLNLYKPGGGSTGLIVPDEVVDVDRFNTNFDSIDTWAQTTDTFRLAQLTRGQQYRGLAANIGAVASPVKGDTYQETDGNKWTWQYDGANWISAVGNGVLIKPTSIASGGGTAVQDDDGSVSFAGVTSASLNGVFSAKFKDYDISLVTSAKSASANTLVRLRAAGTDNSSAVYFYRIIGTSGAGFFESTQSSQTRLDLSLSGYANEFKTFRLINPFVSTEWTRIAEARGMESDGSSYSNTISLAGEHRSNYSADGFTLFPASGNFTGRVRVIGYP